MKAWLTDSREKIQVLPENLGILEIISNPFELKLFTPLHQMAFVNIVTKGDIAHYVIMFQLYSMIIF